MRIVQGILVADDILEDNFACNLSACKGACCVDGDSGAPLDAEETLQLENIYKATKPYLKPEGREVIRTAGAWVRERDGTLTTPLIGENGPCAYINYENGVAVCGIERAWQAGAVPFRKPLSCHLYPIRVIQQEPMTMLYYHKWHICTPACMNGAKLKMPVFRFVKDALVRAFGESFYEELEAHYAHAHTPYTATEE